MKVKVIVRGWVMTQPNQIRTVDIPDQDIDRVSSRYPSPEMAVAEAAFKWGQNDFQPSKNIRSVSVGDVVILGKNKFGIVASLGYHFIDKQGLRKYMKIPPVGAGHYTSVGAARDYMEYASSRNKPILKRYAKDIEKQQAFIYQQYAKFKSIGSPGDFDEWYLKENGVIKVPVKFKVPAAVKGPASRKSRKYSTGIKRY